MPSQPSTRSLLIKYTQVTQVRKWARISHTRNKTFRNRDSVLQRCQFSLNLHMQTRLHINMVTFPSTLLEVYTKPLMRVFFFFP